MCAVTVQATRRQIFVLTAACFTAISSGIMISFPAVLNPSILSPSSPFQVTSDEASWIAASNGITGLPGFLILSPLFQIVGRRYVNIGVNIVLLTGWIILIFANSVADLLIARLIQGIAVGSYYITAITLCEYCDPKRRGYFISVKKISQSFGSLACHSLALVTGWRQISAVAAVPLVMTPVMIFFWPESPAFLAMKGRFEECEKSFIWIHGNSAGKQKELKELIHAQTEDIEVKKNASKISFGKTLVNQMLRKDFLKPFFIVTLLTLAIDACGRYFLLAYLTQILVEITGNKSVAMYCAVASDCLLLCALITSCFLIKIMKRRTILLSLGTLAALLMFLVSLMLVMKAKFGFAADNPWLIPSIILSHSFVSHVGLVPTAFAISAEIFPLEHKGLGSLASGIAFTSFYTLSLKLTPLMIEVTGVAGTYSIYGICLAVCLIILYIILPETKDKTLQEIEDEIKGVERSVENHVLLDNK